MAFRVVSCLRFYCTNLTAMSTRHLQHSRYIQDGYLTYSWSASNLNTNYMFWERWIFLLFTPEKNLGDLLVFYLELTLILLGIMTESLQALFYVELSLRQTFTKGATSLQNDLYYAEWT